MVMDQYGTPNLRLGAESSSCISDHTSVYNQKPEKSLGMLPSRVAILCVYAICPAASLRLNREGT